MAGFAPEVLELLKSPRAGAGGGMPHGSMGGPIGDIFYVNGGADGVTAGVDTNPGTKDLPFLTIEHALSQCTNDHDDYIICWNTYNQDTFPITMTLDSVHVIGVAGPDGSWPALEGADVGDVPAFDFGVGVENCEIAGFNISGGATSPCIDIPSGANMTWIHHCTFGHDWFGGAQDGIVLCALGGSLRNVIIEDNWFLGDTFACGKITAYGIVQTGGGIQGLTIRRNYFFGLASGAIKLGDPGVGAGGSDMHVIVENYFGCAVDQDGIAIFLGSQSYGCLVGANEAQMGRDVMAIGVPYEDQGATANDNHWMSNQQGDTMVYPHS